MQLKKGQVIELDIISLAFGGAGIGKYEGLTVFVEKTMPGDKVKVSFTRIKPKFADADLVEIIKPSAARRHEKCKYSGICGGCQLQFMPYRQQLEQKKQHIIDSFERIGKIYAPPVSDVIPCENEFYYRNKMEFSFGYDAGMNFTLGMHTPGRHFDIMNLTECHLQSKLSYTIVNAIRDFMQDKNWPCFKYSCGIGFLKAVFIREGKRTGEVMVNLSTSDQLPDDFEKRLPNFVKLLQDTASNCEDGDKKIVSIYWTQVISKRGALRRIKEKLLFGKASISERMILQNGDELSFDILPQTFFQVNTLQAEILYNEVVKLVDGKSHEAIFDLYCGTGTIGLFLAKHANSVLGIELNEDAVTIARENAQKNKIFNIDFFTGDVAELLKNLKARPSLIVIDPPRSGITEKIVRQINQFGPAQIIYVSCNPASLARDCAWLKGYGYSVKSIQPVDMFPQTFHIENVCLLER